MTKLSDTQLVVLSAACQRPDRNVLPLPANLKGGAQQKVVGSLLAKSLVEDHDRQIVVLRRDEALDWLDLARPEAELLRPSPPGTLKVESVGGGERTAGPAALL